MDLIEQRILEKLTDSIDRLGDILEGKSKDDIAEIFEDKYQQGVVLKSLISLLMDKSIINEQEVDEYIKDLRERIRKS